MVSTIKTTHIHTPPVTDDGVSRAKVGQQYSKGARDLMLAIATQKNLPKSGLEGASRVFSGLVGSYFRGRERDQDLVRRRSMVEALSRDGSLSPVEKRLIQSGDKGAIQQVLARRNADRRAQTVFDRQMELARQRAKNQRDLATYNAKLKAERDAVNRSSKAPPTKTVMDQYGNQKLVQWDAQAKKWVPASAGMPEPSKPSAATAPASAGGAADGTPASKGSSSAITGPEILTHNEGGKNDLASLPSNPTKPVATPESQIPRGINRGRLAKERAKWLAKWEKEAPEKRAKALNAYSKFKKDIQVVKDHLNQVAKLVNPNQRGKWMSAIPEGSVGFFGQILSLIPGSEASDLRSLLAQPFARFGFEELQSMRNNSPTGGSLGNVSNQEIRFLQNANGALAQAMSPSMFRKQLAKLLNIANRLQEQKAFEFETLFGYNPNTEIEKRSKSNSAGAGPKRQKYNAQTGTLEDVE